MADLSRRKRKSEGALLTPKPAMKRHRMSLRPRKSMGVEGVELTSEKGKWQDEDVITNGDNRESLNNSDGGGAFNNCNQSNGETPGSRYQGDGETLSDSDQGNGGEALSNSDQGGGGEALGDSDQGGGGEALGDSDQGGGGEALGDSDQGGGGEALGDSDQGGGGEALGDSDQGGGGEALGDSDQGDGGATLGDSDKGDGDGEALGDSDQSDGGEVLGDSDQGGGGEALGDSDQGCGGEALGDSDQGDGGATLGDSDGGEALGDSDHGDGGETLGNSDGGEALGDSDLCDPDDMVLNEGVSNKDSKNSKIEGLYKPPTRDELHTLKETQDLFKSNLMKLQITELLGEVKPKRKTPSGRHLESLLHKLKETLLALPSSPQIDLCEGLSLLPTKIQYPLHFTPSKSKGKFKFGPPSCVKVVGSYLLGSMSIPDLNVDLEIHLPKECLQVKDIFNYRYFHKRALYLSIVAGHLRKKKKLLSLKSIMFEWCGGNPLLPVLSIVPEGKHVSKYTIRLHTSLPDPTYFKSSKLGPEKNNVRRHFLPASSHTFSPDGPSHDNDVPTPHYNASLLLEMGARETHMKELFFSAQECPGLVDAVILYKVWARQRSLNKGYGSFTGFHFSMLVSALISHKKINHHMSCYQMFRVVLQHLASTDWTTKGLLTSTTTTPPASLDSFHSAYDVVFLDSSGLINFCADVNKERHQWLRHEASIALKLLDDPTARGFEALFMRPLPVEEKFDALYKIPIECLSPCNSISDQNSRERILLDGFAWPLPRVLSAVLPVLHRGLGKRVKLMTTFVETQLFETSQWLATKSPPCPNRGHVILALLLDTDHAFSILNMGPSADSKEAVEFRSFWGEKSELRRFHDGAINEAVVWDKEPEKAYQDKTTICHRVIQYLLQRNFLIPVEKVTTNLNLLGPILHTSSYEKQSSSTLMQSVHDVFTELSKDLRRLKDLPLAITSLQGSSPTFRYSEVFPSLPWNGKLSSKLRAAPSDNDQSHCYYPSCDTATPPFIPVHRVICQLESSGKWPDEVEAIRKVKVAFYIHLARALKKQKGLVTSPSSSHVDILKGGFVFRVQIHHNRELILLKEKKGQSTMEDPRSLREDLVAVSRTLVSLPVLTSSLNGLHQQFSAYGGGARLCKRWVSSHMLSNHISDEAIELMVAYLFVNPAPSTTPSTSLVVFNRFLTLLSTYDWENEPLIVNFNDELSESQISQLQTDISKQRSSLPPLVIITPHDPRPPSPWSSASNPSAPIFYRLQELAAAAGAMVSKLILGDDSSEENVKQLFRTPLLDFDLLILLNKAHVPCSKLAVDAMETRPSHYQSNWSHKNTHFPVVDFDPAQIYLKKLEEAFSDFALFFYDKYGGPYIAVLWKPHIFEPQSFKVGKAHCKIPSVQGKGKNLVMADRGAIMTDFQVMGEGLVKSIRTLKY